MKGNTKQAQWGASKVLRARYADKTHIRERNFCVLSRSAFYGLDRIAKVVICRSSCEKGHLDSLFTNLL